ncbi:MAG: general secretion pathway protein G, partial [Planctomycetota bacterium]
YCRLPGKKRVYKAKFSGSLSTQFTDWIETDLLKAESFNIDKVTFDNYSVDEGKGEIVPGTKLVIAKGADSKFVLAGLDAAKEQTNEEKANEIGTTLGEIKIVGVRQKPQGLTARLEQANGRDAQLLSRYLNPKGFFLAGGGKLVSNEGDLLFETKSGVRYTLRFGELVLGEGDEVTAGIGSDAPKEGDDPKKNANNRYLMVTVAFDEALLKKPAGVRLAAEELAKRSKARAMIQSIQAALATYTTANEGKLPAALADLTVKPEEGEALLKDLSVDPWGNQYDFVPAGDTYVLMSHAADGKSGGDGANQDVRSDQLPLEDALATAATEWTTFDSKVETGREEAESLTKRFGPWYYVIDKALFDKLKPSRADLVEPKAEEPKPGDAPK